MSAKRILIVEDDADLLLGLRVRMTALGYEVLAAGDAISAVEQARKQGPDAIILDIGLPGGDGFTVMERLRQLRECAAIPIVVLSARDPSTTRERSRELGAVAYFHKPADNEELMSVIECALKRETKSSTEVGDETTQGRGKILVVDDDDDLLRALSIRLRAQGFDVCVARDGVAAVASVRREQPDIMLLDLGLPGGDGFTVIERMKAVVPGQPPPVIVVTAWNLTDGQRETLRHNAFATLPKPIDNERLAAAIDDALGGEAAGVGGSSQAA